MNVNIRDFTRFPYRYLKEGSYVVTKNGVPCLNVVVTLPKIANVVSEHLTELPKTVVTEDKDGLCSIDGCNFKLYTDKYCMRHWKENK